MRVRDGTCLWLLAVLLVLAGCRGSGGELRARSVGEPHVEFAPELSTAVYWSQDANTADIYLSDLPVDRLAGGRAGLGEGTGSLIHVHMFLAPRAGKTPIDETACNMTIRHLVLAGGQRGLYGGGGFLLPGDRAGAARFSASVRSASVKLLRADPGFVDHLRVAEVTGNLTARLDREGAAAAAALFSEQIADLPAASGLAPDRHPAGTRDGQDPGGETAEESGG
ncbi:MAG TPA: hypothetical protein VD963_01025 [Phycisphaerales bacterium]|nr:hypothetical protein [Phycisphaerales bacterium]